MIHHGNFLFRSFLVCHYHKSQEILCSGYDVLRSLTPPFSENGQRSVDGSVLVTPVETLPPFLPCHVLSA